jgi:hypothetical protein
MHMPLTLFIYRRPFPGGRNNSFLLEMSSGAFMPMMLSSFMSPNRHFVHGFKLSANYFFISTFERSLSARRRTWPTQRIHFSLSSPCIVRSCISFSKPIFLVWSISSASNVAIQFTSLNYEDMRYFLYGIILFSWTKGATFSRCTPWEYR